MLYISRFCDCAENESGIQAPASKVPLRGTTKDPPHRAAPSILFELRSTPWETSRIPYQPDQTERRPELKVAPKSKTFSFAQAAINGTRKLPA